MKLHRPAVMLVFKRASLWAACFCHYASAFCLCLLIDRTKLIEQTQANIFASNSRDVARLVMERIWLQGPFYIISMTVWPFYDSMRWHDSVDSPDNLTKNISFVLMKEPADNQLHEKSIAFRKETYSEINIGYKSLTALQELTICPKKNVSNIS